MTLRSRIRRLFLRPVDEVAVAAARLRKQELRIERVRLRNRLAYAASFLESLESRGIPGYREPEPRQEQAPAQGGAAGPDSFPQRPLRTVYAYENNAVTGYPFEPRIYFDRPRFEQDPLYGWPLSPLDGFNWDLMSNIPTNAFPREMWPDRPSSLRTQIAMDATRFQSRLWFEQVEQYAGIIGHLKNYTLGAGMTIEVVSKKDEKLAEAMQEWLDDWWKQKSCDLNSHVEGSIINLLRDGEDAIHVLPGGDYPALTDVDTSWIRGPHNEINGPWSFGVLTSWPNRSDDPRAYNVWYPDNHQEQHSPDVFKHCKLPTTGPNVKRGVPLSYSVRKRLPQLMNLLDAMAIGEAARQSIPYVRQFSQATKQAVDFALNESQRDERPAGMFGERRNEIEPGVVPNISKGMEYQDPPLGAVNQGKDCYQTLCEALAAGMNIPIWFVMGGSDKENYASAFIKEAPIVKRIQGLQRIICGHYKEITRAGFGIAVAQGLFPADCLQTADIHAELPTPIAHDKSDDIKCDLLIVQAGYMSGHHFCTRNELDFQEEQDLIAQERADGFKSPADLYAETVAQSGGMTDAGPEKPAKPQP
jgi:hypothetical protein